MDSEDAALIAQVEALVAQLDAVDKLLAPILDTPLQDTLALLPLQQQARVALLLAEATNVMAYVALKTSGNDVESHPSDIQLRRIDTYRSKVAAFGPRFERLAALIQNGALRDESLPHADTDAALYLADSLTKAVAALPQVNKNSSYDV